MKECRVILARNALDDEPSASTLSAQPGGGHRTIGKCHGRCYGKPKGIVEANSFAVLCCIDHVSEIAIGETTDVRRLLTRPFALDVSRSSVPIGTYNQPMDGNSIATSRSLSRHERTGGMPETGAPALS
jgi:hypothetical protein